MNVWIWTLVTFGIGYLFNAFRVVKPNEVAVRILFGLPRGVEKYGLKFIIWPFEQLVAYSTKALLLEFPDFEVTTSAGKYCGHRREKATVIIERPTLYFQWPADENLLHAYKNLPKPTETEKLQRIFQDIVTNTIRSVCGALTWQELVENPQVIYKKVLAILQDPNADATNPFFRGSVKPLSVEIKGIKLPPELATVINLPEAARFRAEETIIIAEAEAKRIAFVGKGEAEARRVLFDAILQGELPKEALLTLREMAKGKGTTVVLPSEILQVFQGVLGQQATRDELSKWFSGLLTKPDFQQELLKLLKNRLDEDSGES
jgi:regulator of protease activity HflC (stomatin/prohibitin superfamily)